MTDRRSQIDGFGDYVRELEKSRIQADRDRWKKNRELQRKAVRSYRREKPITKNTPRSQDIE